jgi:predicted nucleic acid-binding protein
MALLLISDSNILMDAEAGGLLAELFHLPFTFAVPDILFEEELAENFAHLVAMGLQVREMPPEMVMTAERLARLYRRIGGNDRLALALALAERVDLLTGDEWLRKAADTEGVQVRGTVWILQELVHHGRITREAALEALERMRRSGRRLPWEEARRRIQAGAG